MLGAGLDVFFEVGFFGEKPGAFEDQVDFQVFPGPIGGVFFAEEFDFVAVDGEAVFCGFDFAVVEAVDGVMFYEIGEIICGDQVVDGCEIQVGIFLDNLEDGSADSSEAIDCYVHFQSPPVRDCGCRVCVLYVRQYAVARFIK